MISVASSGEGIDVMYSLLVMNIRRVPTTVLPVPVGVVRSDVRGLLLAGVGGIATLCTTLYVPSAP